MRIYWILFIFFTLISCAKPKPDPECGFTRNVYGQNVKWRHLPIRLYINESISEYRKNAIKAAANTWKMFQIVSSNYDVNVIELSSWDGPTSEQARASLAWTGDTFTTGTVRINLNHNPDLESLMLHELGHVIGLVHKDNTVMDPYLGYTEIRNKLTQYEKDSVLCGYGLAL